MTKIIPYPIYDLTKNSKPYDPQIKTQFRPMLNYRKHNLWRAFVDFLFDNDEKSSFLESYPYQG